jgi:hypothetical protein
VGTGDGATTLLELAGTNMSVTVIVCWLELACVAAEDLGAGLPAVVVLTISMLELDCTRL